MAIATRTGGIQEMVEGLKDNLSVKRVFGEPYEKDGVTVIPVASFGGGGGGGGGGTETEGGSGGAFGLGAKPAGVYVIRAGEVEWKPAIDMNRMITAAQVLIVVGALSWRSVAKRRAKKR